MKIIRCRMCKSNKIEEFLNLGITALADNFLTEKQLNKKELKYPLTVNICHNCGLSQLGYVVPPHEMFNEDYPYDSSTTNSGKNHFIKMSTDIIERFCLEPGQLAVDIGSNTGVLLTGFKSKGFRVLGIDPSSNIAKIAIKNGIDTIIEFFSTALSKEIIKKHGNTSVITATNVFAHIDNLDDFMLGVQTLLDNDGVLVIEAPYFLNLVENLEYDTIYHEHLSYLSVTPMKKFFERFEMELFDVEKQKIHGGTLRYYIGYKGKHNISENISKFLKSEIKKNIFSITTLKKFAKNVEKQKQDLVSLLNELKKNGKKIVGISSPAKGNTLLSYCGIGPETLDYITEKNPLKIGKYTPGTHIKICSDNFLLLDNPDYALILAWNFADEIIKNNEEFRKKGGKFIIPIPLPKIV